MKTVYLVFNTNDMTAHEFIEVWATEEAAKARADELNAKDDVEEPCNEAVAPWDYDSREVQEGRRASVQVHNVGRD
jgi:hypothetical protein